MVPHRFAIGTHGEFCGPPSPTQIANTDHELYTRTLERCVRLASSETGVGHEMGAMPLHVAGILKTCRCKAIEKLRPIRHEAIRDKFEEAL